MSEPVLLDRALCLPTPDIEALIQGRMVAAMPRTFIDPGWQFALYPSDASFNLLPTEQYYCPNFLPIAQTALSQLGAETVALKAWAKCELCQMPNEAESLEALSKLTIWTIEALQEMLRQRQYIFLTYLRVYQLFQPIEVSANLIVREKIGKFIGLPNSPTVTEYLPVLSDRIFSIRKHQLENLPPPLHPELEELLSRLTQLNNPSTQQLEHDIKTLLGWTSEALPQAYNLQPAWINTITELGDRSIELEEKKSNYQTGTDFENIARRSLEFLGFKVEDAYKGGAGGLDLFCSQPYPLVGECKAGKLIPSGTVEELIKLGGMHLGAGQFLKSAKLVIGPGNPSQDMLKAAKEWKVSVINAMTLQKLVELQAEHLGSVNLIELKQYLEPGQTDYRIDEYIDKVQREIKLRSHLIQILKKYQEGKGLEAIGVEHFYGVYDGSNPPKSLSEQEMHEILIELSSPLTGYLGRIRGNDWQSDRFYFLRDLPTN